MEYDFHSVFTLDADNGKLIWRNPPRNHAEKAGCEAGFVNIGKGKNKTYWQVRVFGRTFKRSRVIFYMTHNHWPHPVVDHINGNSLDDRPINLREADYSQNTASSKDKARKSDLPRGVYLTKQGKFIARIRANGKTTNLGTYQDAFSASVAYQVARKETFNEYA